MGRSGVAPKQSQFTVAASLARPAGGLALQAFWCPPTASGGDVAGASRPRGGRVCSGPTSRGA
eukprot:1123662-Pyramimonas_sp.AAC.1